MSTQHTPTPCIVELEFDENTNTLRDANGVVGTVRYADSGREIVRACNSHDALVAALRTFVDGWDSDKGPTVGQIMDARAALAAAESQS